MAKDLISKSRMGGKEVIIRGVRLTDAQALIDLELRLSKESIFLMSETDEINTNLAMQESNLRDMMGSDRRKYLVAVADHRIVGFLIVIAQDLKRICHVGNFIIGVESAYHGMGVSKGLMDGMMDWAKQLGLKRLELDVLEDNVRAIGLYKKYGFLVEGKKIGDYYIGDGHYLNTLIMGKQL